MYFVIYKDSKDRDTVIRLCETKEKLEETLLILNSEGINEFKENFSVDHTYTAVWGPNDLIVIKGDFTIPKILKSKEKVTSIVEKVVGFQI